MDCTERWAAHRREHKLVASTEAAIATIRDKALDLASRDIDRRLSDMNELREQITNERVLYLTRQEYDAKHETLSERLTNIENVQAGMLGRLAIIAGLIGIGVSVTISIVLKFI